ncbi:MAG: class I SAM-dependent methyltransferase [Rhodospirillaceae bacterium]|nr:class I SAM-dependent methyltransferase [Rhodospirillaceae bacterium]
MAQIADRGWIGRWERQPTLDSESYSDFCEGIRKFAQEGTRGPAMAAASKAAEAAKAKGVDLTRINDIRSVFDPVPQLAVRNRMMRTLQEMTWRGLRNAYYADAQKYLDELNAYDKKGPGTVEWSADFNAPAYAQQPIHIQPGGYYADPLAGYWYYDGSHSFFIGKNTQDEGHLSCANSAKIPADGKVKRIMDIGVSVGQLTVGLKERFPDAEVWGIDTSAPMVRYAHKRAVDLGVAVNFSQRNAEDTKFPDAHFDMITSYILFHEVQNDRIETILREVYRQLRPGGTFSIFDFPYDVKQMPPFMQYIFTLDRVDNCEPYAMEFVTMDFTRLLKRVGFQVETGPDQIYAVKTIYCTKPA